MDTSQWPQGIGVVKTVEPSKTVQERKPRPQKEVAVNCPRCNSTNTKFCYYNNYSLSQPRYFCKTCRRYWTEGGSLRNVPVGGGSRKNKRSSFNNNSSYSNNNNNNNSSSSTSSSSKKHPDLTTPKIMNEPHHDLNFSNISEFMALPFGHDQNKGLHLMNPNSTTSFLEANALFSSTTGLPNLHDLKPTLNFSLDHGFENNGYGNLQGAGQEINGAKLFFPLDDLKTVSTDPNDHHDFEQNKGHHHQTAEANGFWNGMLGGGSSW